MSADRWPFDPNIPHTDVWPCRCQDCRNRRAGAQARWARAVRRENERHMVDPDYTRDRKR